MSLFISSTQSTLPASSGLATQDAPYRQWGGNYRLVDNNRKVKPESGSLINGSARDTQAALYRQQFNDYIARFGGAEQELVDAYGNVGLRNERIAAGVGYSNKGFDNAERAQEVTQSRYQIPLTPQQKQDQDRRFAQSRSLGAVDITNRTRQHMVDRDAAMLTGGLSDYRK